MEPLTKTHSRIANLALTVVTIAVLFAFCYVAQLSLIIPVLLLYVGIHLALFRKASRKLFLQLGLLLCLLLVGSYYFLSNNTDPARNYIPVATVVMLTMLLFNDLQLSFLMAFLSSVLVGLLADGDFSLMLISFVGCLTGAYTVRGARTRGQLINAGFYTGLMQVACSLLLNWEIFSLLPKEKFFVTHFLTQYVQPFFVNGLIAAFAVMATSKIFEWTFGVMTNFSLLELADFNQPLLRRMILEAPGTYHHSLLVSNLAESAAEAIGANALLTRVGALYHDIGKMVKPEYFTENQLHAGNKHDNLEPSMSRLVILNHVKEGIELAEKYKLNSRIVDFIPQHHGTGLIHYFYQKALEERAEGEEVDEENFRYPGPKPQTKETALVMLADSVEGATRALDEPTPTKIDELVRKVINNRFIDGQLDECNLTLKEIEKICSTFSRVLAAMHHSRVKYPEKKNGDDDHDRKPAENGSAKSRPNPLARKKNP